MDFYAVLDQVTALLQQRGRVSYRAVKLQFALDDETLAAIKTELIAVQHLATDERDTVLIWAGRAAPGLTLSRETSPTPLAYTPPHLADKIVSARSLVSGERKQVTVLVVDVQSMLDSLAGHDAREAQALLDAVLQHLLTAVHRFEGTVTEVQNASLLALFGAPVAHEDHAVRACYAALALQEAIRRYSAEVRRTHGLEMQVRVGLHVGEVIVHTIGDDLQMDYTTVGSTVHLARHLGQRAAAGSIRLSADTVRLVEGLVQVTPLGPMPIPGMPAPMRVFELAGAGPTRRRLQAAAPRGLTRFVGRQHEFEALRQALERAGAGHGQVGAFVGEPGVGKSRLAYEFTHAQHTQGWLILESSAVSYGKGTPYFPLLDLLSAYFEIDAQDDGRRMREKVTGKLLTLDPTLGPTLPALLALLDARVEDPQWQALDPSQRRQRIQEAITRLLWRESQGQPVLLVLEDLHWLDAETQSVLDTLVESLPSTRMLLLVNYRPEYQFPWGSRAYVTQFRLDPLPPVSAHALLHALLGTDNSLVSLTSLLITRTEGNPFFLEESVRTLVDMEVLVGTHGAYRLAQTVTEVHVPTTVQAMLAARMDRLLPEDKRLLQTAAVIGTEVPFTLLQALAECPEAALRRGLMHLQSAALLHEAALFPNLEYRFEHALTHEVAYGSLEPERQRALHARIVAAIEGLYPERLTEHVERLAHHAVQGAVWEKALLYCREASAKAAMRSAYHEVIAYVEQALLALQQLPESQERRAQAIDLQLDLYYAFSSVGAFARMLPPLREAESLAETLADPQRLGQVLASMSRYYLLTGNQPRALEFGQRALVLAEECGNHAVFVLATLTQGMAYHALGDYPHAIASLRRNMTVLAGELRRERFGLVFLPVVGSAHYLAWSLALVGAFAEGVSQAQHGIRVAEEVNHHPASLCFASMGLGRVYLYQGEFPRAIHALEQSLELCRAKNLPIMRPAVTALLGYAYALCGRVAEALPLLEQAVQGTASMGFMAYRAERVAWLSEAYLLAGRLAEARQTAAHAPAPQEQGEHAYTLRLLGAIATQYDPPEVEAAEAAYQQAIALATTLGLRPLLAHCHLGLATLYHRTGQRAAARLALTAALTVFRSLDMPWWRERAEALLAEQ